MNPGHRPRAALLAGATGSGKTPLGIYLASNGLWGSRCFHFDFGAELRRINAGKAEHDLSRSELEVIRKSLATGSVLEQHDYGIAGNLIRRFVSANNSYQDDWILLNGFPRNAGQAACVSEFLDLRALIMLTAGSEVARTRIRLDSGGDRAGRSDDTTELVERKLEDFREQYNSLIHFFEARSAAVYYIPVSINTGPEEIGEKLEKQAAGQTAGEG
ncbi:MAG: nucleoside monophosphate kinase [Verrucomicrobiota bacterium]